MSGTVVTEPPRMFQTPGLPIVTREQADSELASLTRTIEAISASLLDLENHPGHQLLRSYPQSGQTGRQWSEVRDAMAGLWEDFARYRAVADSAKEIRSRRHRPDPNDLAELTSLLHGLPVELDSRAVPLSERTLTGPAATSNRIGLAGLATRMNQTFERAGDLVTRVDAVATAVRVGLTPLQQAVAAARELTGLVPGSVMPARAPVGSPDDPDLAALETLDARIVELTRRSVSDALSITDPVAEVAALAADLDAVHERLLRAADVRRTWPEKLAAIRDLAVQIGAVQQQTRRARETVAATIRTAPLPLSVDRLAEVNSRIEALNAVTGWSTRIRALDQATALAQNALTAAIADEQLATGLLQRRIELKGRLSAYRAKATRLGRVADQAADDQYDRARAALAAVPCDLAAATTLVTAYQDLVLSATGRTPGRPA